MRKSFIAKAIQTVLAVALLLAPVIGGATTASAQTDIVGGQDSTKAWTVSLQSVKSDGTGNHECGGALIAPKWVLTARHCEPYIHGFARVGSLNWASDGDLVPVSQVIVYPQPGPHGSFGNDVALVKLSRQVDVKYWGSILPLGIQGPNGTLSTTAGWGLTCDNHLGDPNASCWNSTASSLQQLDLSVVPDQRCNLAADDGTQLNDPDSMNCYEPVKAKTGPCFGDSGSPYLRWVSGTPHKGVPRVVGLDNAEMSTTVFTANVCSVAPNGGAYHEADSDVGHFIPWIIQTIRANGDNEGADMVQHNANSPFQPATVKP